jgi:DNA-binding phage protein
MNPAHDIIAKLGGATKVARSLGLTRAAVYHWRKPGKGIPYWYYGQLLRHARAHGIKLKPADFVGRLRRE